MKNFGFSKRNGTSPEKEEVATSRMSLAASFSAQDNVRKQKHSLLWIAVVCLLTAVTAGCARNEFTISFDLPAEVNDTYRFIYHASSSHRSFMIETVAAINKGKGEVKCMTKNPCIVYLFSSSSLPRLMFWVERGDKIKIKGSGRDPMEWEVKGNKISEEWSRWRLDHLKALKSGNASEINKAVSSFVKQNLDNQLSALLLLTYYNRRADEEGFSKLWKELGKDAKADEMAEIVARSDSPEREDEISKLGHIVGRKVPVAGDTTGESNDTLLPLSAKATLLYFHTTESSGRDEAFDTLRSLAKRYPDRKNVIIAAVGVDNDSATWVNVARRDTLPGVHRIWMPGGIASRTLQKIGLRRADYFIVTDGRGKRIYGGSEAKKAASALRGKI